MKKDYRILVGIPLLLLLFFFLGWTLKPNSLETPAPSPGSPAKGQIDRRGVVSHVIDGDTIEPEGGERVRYLGIDAPEKGRPFFSEATEANEKLVAGQEVGLELDVQTKDKYGRTLAYVWVGERMANFELVYQGFANVYTFPPNVRYEKQFLAAERTVRKAKRGLWGFEGEIGREL